MANELMTCGIGASGLSGLNLNLAGTPIGWYEVDGYARATGGALATNGQGIETIPPIFGSQGDLSQLTSASAPTLITGQTSNGKAIARFDGTADHFNLTNSLAIAQNVSAFSIIFVVKFNAVAVDQSMVFVSTPTASATRFVWRILAANSGLCFTRTLDADTGGSASTTGFTAATGTFYTFHVSMNYATSKIDAWVNGVQRITNATPATNTAGNTSNTASGAQLAIGRDNAGSRYLNGDMVAWGAYSNVFTAQQVADSYAAIQTYLGV
jgi:hypothetical protein